MTNNISTVTTINTVLDESGFWEQPNNLRDCKPLKFDQDPLALSWASYGVWMKNSNHRWADFNNVIAHEHDIEMAEITRKFYREQLVVDALKGATFTSFKKALGDIVSGDVPLQQQHLGVLYRLPYFYVEDLARGALRKEFDRFPKQLGSHTEGVRDITYVQTIFKSRRARETQEFWFRDQRGEPVMWAVDNQNSLLSIVESLAKKHKKDPIRIKGTFRIKDQQGKQFFYWALMKPEFA